MSSCTVKCSRNSLTALLLFFFPPPLFSGLVLALKARAPSHNPRLRLYLQDVSVKLLLDSNTELSVSQPLVGIGVFILRTASGITSVTLRDHYTCANVFPFATFIRPPPENPIPWVPPPPPALSQTGNIAGLILFGLVYFWSSLPRCE